MTVSVFLMAGHFVAPFFYLMGRAVKRRGSTLALAYAIKNTDRLMGKHTGVAYAGEIEMVILPPIPTAGKTSDDVMDLLLKTREAIGTALSEPPA